MRFEVIDEVQAAYRSLMVRDFGRRLARRCEASESWRRKTQTHARTGPQRALASEDTDRSGGERSEPLDGVQKLLTGRCGGSLPCPG